MCCSLTLCETCQTYVLRVQIWVWNLQLPPVLLLSPCIWGSQINRLIISVPFQEGLPQFWLKFKQYQLRSRLLRGSRKVHRSFYRTNFTLWTHLERGNIRLWRRKRQPTPVLLPGKSRGWTEEPGRFQFMGSQSWTRLSDFTSLQCISWDRFWLLTQELEFWEKLLLLEMNGLNMRQG